MMLISLFAVGCGGSGSDEFVVVGNDANNNNPQVPTGAVTFQFATPQVDVTAIVPGPTRTLHIDFLNSQNVEVFETVPDVDFAPTVTVNGVPVTATQALVTAFDANKVPLATLRFSLSVQEGQSSSATPLGPGFPVTFDTVSVVPSAVNLARGGTQQLVINVGFSNGSTLSAASAGGVASFVSGNTTAATVSSTGLVTAVNNGETKVTVNYTLNGVSKIAEVAVKIGTGGGGGGGTTGGTTGNTTGGTTGNTTGGTTGNTTGTTTGNTTGNTPARLVIAQSTLFVNAAGGNTSPLSAVYFAANSTVGVTVPAGGLQGVAKNPSPAGTENRWTFNASNSTITASGTAGQPAENNTIQFTVTHTPVSGAAASADITVTAVNVADPRLTAIVSSQLLGPTSLTLPSGTRYPFVVVNTLGDGTRMAATPGIGTVGQVSIDPASSTSIGTFDSGTHNRLTAAPLAASGTVTIRRLTTAPSTFTTVGTVSVTVVNTTLATTGANVVLTPSANSIKGGTQLLYKIEWRFQNGSSLDVTSFYAYTNTAPINAFVADAASGLASGLAPTATVAAPTGGTIGIGAVLLADVQLPAGTVSNGPTANINVTP